MFLAQYAKRARSRDSHQAERWSGFLPLGDRTLKGYDLHPAGGYTRSQQTQYLIASCVRQQLFFLRTTGRTVALDVNTEQLIVKKVFLEVCFYI